MLGKRRLWTMVLTVVLVVMAGSDAVLGAKVREFTADNVMLDAGGKVKSRGKVYMTADKMRAEHDMKEMGKMVLIYRRDKNVLWALNSGKKIYVAMPMDIRKWEEDTKGMIKSENAQILGKETVNGYPCVKKRVTRTTEMMGMNMTITQTIWISDQIEMPIRTRNKRGQITELRNIKEGPPPAMVFEIPAGYKKVGDNMMALFMADKRDTMPAANQHGGGSGGINQPFKLPNGIKNPFNSN